MQEELIAHAFDIERRRGCLCAAVGQIVQLLPGRLGQKEECSER